MNRSIRKVANKISSNNITHQSLGNTSSSRPAFPGPLIDFPADGLSFRHSLSAADLALCSRVARFCSVICGLQRLPFLNKRTCIATWLPFAQIGRHSVLHIVDCSMPSECEIQLRGQRLRLLEFGSCGPKLSRVGYTLTGVWVWG